VLAVAAANRKLIATNDSNAGLHASNGGAVELAGPGTEVYSCCSPDAMPYALESGTSAATPFVAGAAAQLLEREPSLSAEAVWTRLVETARPAEHPTNDGSRVEDIGAGMVQAPQQ
jgi:subtilisin family serine protease